MPLKSEDVWTENIYSLCSNCHVELKNVKINIRQHIGCPAGCGGIMREHKAGLKCSICGIFFSSKLD